MMSEWCWKELLLSESLYGQMEPCHMPGGGSRIRFDRRLLKKNDFTFCMVLLSKTNMALLPIRCVTGNVLIYFPVDISTGGGGYNFLKTHPSAFGRST